MTTTFANPKTLTRNWVIIDAKGQVLGRLASRIVERDKTGLGVMVFPDSVFKYTSNMVKHIPELGQGTTP